MTSTPVYENAPIALAVIEIRHPEAEQLSRGELAGLKQQFHKIAPFQVNEQQTDFQVQVGPSGPAPVSGRTRALPRFLARDRMTSISYGSEAISIETTNYRGWDEFRGVVEAALLHRQDISPVDGLERIGLRYIDEIRIPRQERGVDWADWIAPDLLAPNFSDSEWKLVTRQQQCLVQYDDPRNGHTLTLRYGAVDGPPAVAGGPSLARPSVPSQGQYFLIDIDAAWTLTPGESVPELDPASALDIADDLHSPIKGLFESLITEKLRREVLQIVADGSNR